MNMENNAQFTPPPNSPQSDPRIDRLIAELEKNWNQYQLDKRVVDQLVSCPTLPEELVRILKESALKRLEGNVSKSMTTYMETPSFSGTGGGTAFSLPRVKKLCRVDYDKMLAGVCGGIGEYLNLDSTIVRLLFVIGTFFYLFGLIAYIVLLILLPVKMSPQEEI